MSPKVWSPSRFVTKVEQARAHPPCPYCGGRWSYVEGRVWHTGHPRDCWRKAQRARHEAEETALRGGGIPVRECGCSGTEHREHTCSRWFEFYPDAEMGVEHGAPSPPSEGEEPE